ncbi:RimK/LysX family protein [uncultured Sunxiuqinia sp.]|uniref:ATP-dependent zinc protease family protein n=1 Tax=uncultured Sunxiuqinia sp. TaxID=1573825 RepID=UPI002AA8C1E3|nr:RimK/LysX family protein [uncultured Sunxiuqinia sp.]
MTKSKIVIGREDIADFPLLNLGGIEVKTDSGAYTSSFHCHNIELISVDGVEKLKCYFLDPEHDKYRNKEFIFETFVLKKVKSSNGQMEERYSISTEIRLFEKTYPIDLTLTERGSMKFPVLLGRKFLSKRFVVDSSLTNLSQKGKIKIVTY